jgi:hypothetical protein
MTTGAGREGPSRATIAALGGFIVGITEVGAVHVPGAVMAEYAAAKTLHAEEVACRMGVLQNGVHSHHGAAFAGVAGTDTEKRFVHLVLLFEVELGGDRRLLAPLQSGQEQLRVLDLHLGGDAPLLPVVDALDGGSEKGRSFGRASEVHDQ